MVMLQALVLFCVSGSILAQIISTGECPPVKSQRNFNYTRFIGRWYQVKRYSSKVEDGSKCTFRDYAPGEDGNPLTATQTFSYGIIPNVLSATRKLYAPDEDYPAEFEMQSVSTNPNVPSNFFILGTDYDNYAVTYSCNKRGSVTSTYAWLDFRKRHPKKSILKKAYKVLCKNNINTSKLRKVDQTDCRDGPALLKNAF